jgi:mono/diheme cytochrome c family protein
MNKLQMLAVAGFIALGVVAVYLNGTSSSSRPAHVTTPPSMAGLEPGDPIVSVIVPKTFSDKAIMGKRAFDAVCAACHGENAAGVMGAGPTFISRIYEPAHHGDISWLNAPKNGVMSHHWPFGNMPPQKGLTQSDLKNLVAYVRELQRANGIN